MRAMEDSTASLLPPITVEEALDDLPKLYPLRDEIACFNRKIDSLFPYSSPHPRSEYQQGSRTWPGFETPGSVCGNVIRNTPRDFPIFARMREGENYVFALKYAEEIFQERKFLEESRIGRCLIPEEISELRKKTIPPYDPEKFSTKWLKLDRKKPSHTVVAHLQADTYSHIHYDSTQARAISVREAARLQSFPDGFRFLGSMRESFAQIGNAVPPLMAFAIGRQLLSRLQSPQ